jgi:hypothetical protein
LLLEGSKRLREIRHAILCEDTDGNTWHDRDR